MTGVRGSRSGSAGDHGTVPGSTVRERVAQLFYRSKPSGLADVLKRPARAQGTLLQSQAHRGLRHAAGVQSGGCLIALLAPKSSTSAWAFGEAADTHTSLDFPHFSVLPIGIWPSATPMAPAMSLLCLIGRHKPSIQSLGRTGDDGYKALCQDCGTPLLKARKGTWQADRPLASARSFRTSSGAKGERED